MISTLDKLFNKKPESVQAEHQVRILGEAVADWSRQELEDAAEHALDLLLTHASDVALGPAAGVSFDKCQVELEFTVVATTSAELHKKLGKVMRLLEQEGPMRPSGSSTSRLDAEEAVLA